MGCIKYQHYPKTIHWISLKPQVFSNYHDSHREKGRILRSSLIFSFSRAFWPIWLPDVYPLYFLYLAILTNFATTSNHIVKVCHDQISQNWTCTFREMWNSKKYWDTRRISEDLSINPRIFFVYLSISSNFTFREMCMFNFARSDHGILSRYGWRWWRNLWGLQDKGNRVDIHREVISVKRHEKKKILRSCEEYGLFRDDCHDNC